MGNIKGKLLPTLKGLVGGLVGEEESLRGIRKGNWVGGKDFRRLVERDDRVVEGFGRNFVRGREGRGGGGGGGGVRVGGKGSQEWSIDDRLVRLDLENGRKEEKLIRNQECLVRLLKANDCLKKSIIGFSRGD